MNKAIIVDSSAIVSLYLPNDRNNAKAVDISKNFSEEGVTLIIPSDIFSETINAVGKKINHKAAISIGIKLLNDQNFTIKEATDNLRLVALSKLAKQSKGVSFTDCIVMAFADEFETKEIFGFDEAFRKNGYIRVGIDNPQVLS